MALLVLFTFMFVIFLIYKINLWAARVATGPHVSHPCSSVYCYWNDLLKFSMWIQKG